MSEYSAVLGGQLKLKGSAGRQFRKNKKRKRGHSSQNQEELVGDFKHGKD